MSDPVFPGVHALLTLVRTLYRRPRYFERDRELGVRGDLPLPLVCLLRADGAEKFLPSLGKRLDEELSEVPHVLVDVAAPAKHPEAVLPLLHSLRTGLGERPFGRRGSLKRFDNYDLAHHLTGVKLTAPQAKRDLPIKKALNAWGRGDQSAAAETATEAADRVGGHASTFVWTLKLIGYLFGVYWGRDRVVGLARERRWFLRQPYMVPKHSPGFLRFAERLTEGRRDAENTEQVHKLLVHALLEDLRRAYRRDRWRFLPRRPGWRRTAYVTVLLDNVHADGGWELLRLINEVRNETGELDPLLLITAGDGPPPGLPPGRPQPTEPTVAENSLAGWKDRLPKRRQQLAADARYLFVTLPAPTTDGAEQAEDVWRPAPDDEPRPTPFLARRGIGELLAAVVLVAALLPTSITAVNHWSVDCAFFRAATDGISTRVASIDGQD